MHGRKGPSLSRDLLILKIPDKCMVQADKGPTRRDAFCENDLKCICKTDNHLGSNSLFSNECLLQECTDGHDRKRKYIQDIKELMMKAKTYSISEKLVGVVSGGGEVRLGRHAVGLGAISP